MRDRVEVGDGDLAVGPDAVPTLDPGGLRLIEVPRELAGGRRRRRVALFGREVVIGYFPDDPWSQSPFERRGNGRILVPVPRAGPSRRSVASLEWTLPVIGVPPLEGQRFR